MSGSRPASRSAGGRALRSSDRCRSSRFCQRYVALQIFARGIPAVEERRAQFAPFLAQTASNDRDVELDSAIDIPRYYETEWHLEPGGWEGYDLYSAMFSFGVGPYVFRHGGYAAVNVGDDLSESRREALRRLPKQAYGRIYEPGCGTGTTLAMIHEAFPEAELVACDLSPQVLRACKSVAEKFGFEVALKQRDAVKTGEPDASFDAVFTYALHHEMPPKENIKLFAEMFRILKPGGDIMLVDPPPFREVELFHAVILDWDTANRGEPFFSQSSLANWDEELAKTGFEAVESFPIGRNGYPWVIRARKPALAAHAQAA